MYISWTRRWQQALNSLCQLLPQKRFIMNPFYSIIVRIVEELFQLNPRKSYYCRWTGKPNISRLNIDSQEIPWKIGISWKCRFFHSEIIWITDTGLWSFCKINSNKFIIVTIEIVRFFYFVFLLLSMYILLIYTSKTGFQIL